MRAQGRNYRGGFTRDEISRGEHNLQTCRTRGCNNRTEHSYCSACRGDDGGSSSSRSDVSDPKLVSKLMDKHNSADLRRIASANGVKRKRGDSKKQTAWRIVKQNRRAAVDACY